MNDDHRGIAGDRRRNPFPSLNDTEYELFLITIREQVRDGVKAGMASYRKDNCVAHLDRTEHLEVLVFGDPEKKIVGLDAKLSAVDATISQLRRVTWTAVSALIVGFIGLLVGLVQFAILGR